jgi:hypothetical protein
VLASMIARPAVSSVSRRCVGLRRGIAAPVNQLCVRGLCIFELICQRKAAYQLSVPLGLLHDTLLVARVASSNC